MPQEQLATYQGSALSAENLGHTSELAVRLSKSDLLPPHFKGKPENVLLVLALAQNLNINPIMALQQVSVIGGKPCLQASLMLSLLNNSGKITGPIRFEWVGQPAQPSRGCIAKATDAATGETVQSEPVTLAMAQAEGWTRNAKYKSIPDTMLKWRAASFFVRTYYPEVVLGLHSAEELTDVEREARNDARAPSARDRLREIRSNATRDVTPNEESTGTTPENAADSNTDGFASQESAASFVDAEPVEETADIGILTDFLTGVSECEDSDELTAMVEHSNSFEGAARKTAKTAIMERSKVLGLIWDRDGNEFVKGGAK
jgi:hypothetical protein